MDVQNAAFEEATITANRVAGWARVLLLSGVPRDLDVRAGAPSG